MNNLNQTLNQIDLTYQYISEIYKQTNSGYIKENKIKSEELKGLNPKSLAKYNFLSSSNGSYLWKGVIPQYFHAYDYYNAVRGKKKNYEGLLILLKNPENSTVDEILEALAVKGAYALYGLENNNENVVIDNNFNIDLEATKLQIEKKESDVLTPIELYTIKNNDLMSKLDINFKSLLTKFDSFLKDNEIIKELLTDVVNVTIENTTALGNNQNSISMVIAILKTNQDNLFDITASQYYVLRELYANLLNAQNNNDAPEIKIRLEKTGVALKEMKKRMDANGVLVNKYGKR